MFFLVNRVEEGKSPNLKEGKSPNLKEGKSPNQIILKKKRRGQVPKQKRASPQVFKKKRRQDPKRKRASPHQKRELVPKPKPNHQLSAFSTR